MRESDLVAGGFKGKFFGGGGVGGGRSHVFGGGGEPEAQCIADGIAGRGRRRLSGGKSGNHREQNGKRASRFHRELPKAELRLAKNIVRREKNSGKGKRGRKGQAKRTV